MQNSYDHHIPRLTAFILCTLAYPVAFAQETESIQQSIVNGTRDPRSIGLSPGEQLAVGWISNYRAAETTFCTGTLITSRIVITAKHCTEGREADTMSFGLGVEPTEAVAIFDIARKDEHPLEDATMLFLEQDAVDTLNEANRGMSGLTTTVIPISANRHTLAGQDREQLIGRTVEVTGYGETQDPDKSGRYFARVVLSDVDEEFIVVDGNGDAGLCFGDSGGPVITANLRGKPVILGVEHGGDDTCSGRDFLVRLDQIRDWIDNGLQSMWTENPIGGPCHDLSFLGRCVGNTAEWCDERQQIRRLDCAANQSVCLFVDQERGFYCARPPHCDRNAAHCDSKHEGFMPSGPIRVSNVGGCTSVGISPEGIPWPTTALFLSLGLCGYWRRRPRVAH
jgi:V8-like Glu-specific endopeptidase